MMLFFAGAAFAGNYNKVPAGDQEYAACVTYSNKKYDGGNAKSPIAGQTKAEAWCTCLWNETPNDFTGGLAQYAESSKGKAVKATCETYSNWK